MNEIIYSILGLLFLLILIAIPNTREIYKYIKLHGIKNTIQNVFNIVFGIIFFILIVLSIYVIFPSINYGDNVTAYVALSDKCSSYGLCDIKDKNDLYKIEYVVNVDKNEVTMKPIKPDGIFDKYRNCIIIDKYSWSCVDGNVKMVDGKLEISDNFHMFFGGPNSHGISAYEYRLNWTIQTLKDILPGAQ